MEKILISACLVGEKTRYDGKVIPVKNQHLISLMEIGRLIPFCPETAGGLPVPRPPAEISDGTGLTVLQSRSRIINRNGEDVTDAFITGAKKAVEVSRHHKIRVAILKNGSPSCGSTHIYDGSFTGTKIQGNGVTTDLLIQNNIRVFTEHDIESALAYIKLRI